MKIAMLAWVLTVSPHPWDKRDIATQSFETQAECLHAAVSETVADREHHLSLDWRCRRIKSWVY
jgi:hypothetical protein